MHDTGNIFLIGLMGAGKTTIGKHLARRLGKTFCDSDHEIERHTGVNVPLIFEMEGEAGFRRRESAVLATLVTLPDIVLATGGGIVLDPGNRALLRQNGTVIYLCAGVDTLWTRTRHDKNRPLLQGANPRARLEALFAERDPLYRETAHIIVDTGPRAATTTARCIEDLLAEHVHAHG